MTEKKEKYMEQSKLKKQRKTLSKRYKIIDRIEDGELVIEFSRKGEVKARIILDNLDENTYVVEKSCDRYGELISENYMCKSICKGGECVDFNTNKTTE